VYDEGFSERFSSWLHSVWRTRGPHLWHVPVSGYVKVQTSDDTCEGVCAAKLRNENTREPRVPGLFEDSHWWRHKNFFCFLSQKLFSAFYQSAFSDFFGCPHNCIFEDSVGHNGPARFRNTNLSALASETMWSQPILIELLAVLLLFQTHMHFPSRNLSPFSLRTCLNSSWGHFHFTAQNVY
jgi:hypothetical protein